MTVEQLLIPRYKVINKYPAMQDYFKVGDVISDNGKTAVLNQNGRAVPALAWDEYPHLFQPLKWYEERKINDMPEYLKTLKGEIIKVSKYVLVFERCIDTSEHKVYKLKYCMPSTETEHQTYLNGK